MRKLMFGLIVLFVVAMMLFAVSVPVVRAAPDQPYSQCHVDEKDDVEAIGLLTLVITVGLAKDRLKEFRLAVTCHRNDEQWVGIKTGTGDAKPRDYYNPRMEHCIGKRTLLKGTFNGHVMKQSPDELYLLTNYFSCDPKVLSRGLR
jgi:hypothetical protein